MKSSLTNAATFIILFSLTLSCNEQEVTVNPNNTFSSGTISDGQNKSSSRARSGDLLFDGSEGDPIDINTATRWAANYKATLENPNDIRAHFFGTEILQLLLNESGCVGIRMYYALDDNGIKKLLLVGVDASGEDLRPVEGVTLGVGGNIVADFSFPCPDYCPPKSL
ncbi:MAG: hypothetical protein JNM78_11015 [Cyclobacteriaceae bacterium]|nr:hypothetical protein [Cyclobacteriaceae bacterium]